MKLTEKIRWWGPLKLPSELVNSKLYHSHWKSKPLVVIQGDDRIYAFENRCPHQGAKFNGGACKDSVVICPVHRYAFRLDDGLGLNSPGQNLEMLVAERRIDGIYVGVEYTTISLFGLDLW